MSPKREPIGSALTRRFWLQTKAQDLIEYALFLAFIAIAGAVAAWQFGPSIRSILSKLQRRSRR